MRLFFFLSLLLLCFNNLYAQKTINDPMAQLRSVKGYRAVKVSGGIDLFLSYGSEAVAVSAKDAETRDRIKTEVNDGVLHIWYEWKDKGNIFPAYNKQLKAYVSYKTLLALSGSGGSDILVDGTIKGPELSLNISGGSDFRGKVEVKTLHVEASGGSDVDIEGSAANVVVDASGGSDLNGFNLEAHTAHLEASGGCDIELTVSGTLTASASGGSDIRYKGAAKTHNTKSSGASSVKKVGR